jgi:hypothetical protein
MRKPTVPPSKTKTVTVHHSMLLHERGDILRRLGGGYVRVLDIREVPVQRPSPGSATFIEPTTPAEAAIKPVWTTVVEMTFEECDRPLNGIYVVGVWNDKAAV